MNQKRDSNSNVRNMHAFHHQIINVHRLPKRDFYKANKCKDVRDASWSTTVSMEHSKCGETLVNSC